MDKTWFIKPFRFIFQTPLSSLFGSRFIDATITTIKNLDGYPEGFKAQNQKANYIRSLNLLAGKDFISTGDIEYWYGSGNYDPFARINSNEFWEQCFTWITKYPKSLPLRNTFINMGFYPGIGDPSFFPDSVFWFGEIRKNNTENILALNSIAMLWVGYPDEKLQAANFLKNKTGWTTDNPHYYLKWYRNKYFGVNY